jgi:uncharacterized membrane protein YqjE
MAERGQTQLARRTTTTPAVKKSDASTVGLFKEALGESVDVLQAHVELAVHEVKEDARAAVRIGVGFGVGAALGFVAIGLFSAGAVLGLALWIPAWAAALAVGCVYALVAVIYVGIARARLRNHDFRPEQTLATIEEHKEWIRGRLS